MRKIAYLLIGLGILIILFPKMNEWIDDIKQQKLLEAVKTSAVLEENGAENESLRNEYLVMSQALETQSNETEVKAKTIINGNIVKEKSSKTEHKRGIAVIKISKIDLELPVLEGATKSNMKYAAAHLKETTSLGGVGNAAIAAHRAHTKGRLFNRLNEMEIGDEIIIEAKGSQFVYTVDKISIVKPTDVSVLDIKNPDDKVLTLITCDPLVNPTHRLIVRAKIHL
ncbi:sortase A [Fontibacillus phaseoli]|uniref:Sortase A n=1 Tax=Fontibacillus phaseoli TaxID=1416533 RepID=A0A369B6V0_9BACL|nr:class D sortase [Fontibacillus phaseoli]RCX16257.1 sortase A [Fontibacillus phaseoli]